MLSTTQYKIFGDRELCDDDASLASIDGISMESDGGSWEYRTDEEDGGYIEGEECPELTSFSLDAADLFDSSKLRTFVAGKKTDQELLSNCTLFQMLQYVNEEPGSNRIRDLVKRVLVRFVSHLEPFAEEEVIKMINGVVSDRLLREASWNLESARFINLMKQHLYFTVLKHFNTGHSEIESAKISLKAYMNCMQGGKINSIQLCESVNDFKTIIGDLNKPREHPAAYHDTIRENTLSTMMLQLWILGACSFDQGVSALTTIYPSIVSNVRTLTVGVKRTWKRSDDAGRDMESFTTRMREIKPVTWSDVYHVADKARRVPFSIGFEFVRNRKDKLADTWIIRAWNAGIMYKYWTLRANMSTVEKGEDLGSEERSDFSAADPKQKARAVNAIVANYSAELNHCESKWGDIKDTTTFGVLPENATSTQIYNVLCDEYAECKSKAYSGFGVKIDGSLKDDAGSVSEVMDAMANALTLGDVYELNSAIQDAYKAQNSDPEKDETERVTEKKAFSELLKRSYPQFYTELNKNIGWSFVSSRRLFVDPWTWGPVYYAIFADAALKNDLLDIAARSFCARFRNVSAVIARATLKLDAKTPERRACDF